MLKVRANLRITYRNKPKCLNLIESFFKKFEELYEQEVLSLVSRINGSNVSSEETKIVLNTMFADTITSTLPIAPWEEGICKVCGKDENDHVLLLCDVIQSIIHTVYILHFQGFRKRVGIALLAFQNSQDKRKKRILILVKPQRG